MSEPKNLCSAMAAKKAAVAVSQEGIAITPCPHNNKVTIIVTNQSRKLVTCMPLHRFFQSRRTDGGDCQELSDKGCPFELHNKLISQ